MDRQSIRNAAEEIAQEVGRRVGQELSSYEPAEFSRKGLTDIVTDTDLWAEEQITEFVRKNFSGHLVVGEESGGGLAASRGLSLRELSSRGVCWIVDPIDGTTNFTSRIPFLAISIGVLIEGVREVGVVYDPARGELFSALRGEGATLNGRRIEVSEKNDLVDAVISVDLSRSELKSVPGWARPEFFNGVRAVRRFGSAALEQSWVACGRLDVYFEVGLKPWDVAAGSLLVEEAGGCAKTLESPVAFDLFGTTFLFSTPGLLEKMK